MIMAYHMLGESRALSLPLDKSNRERVIEDMEAIKACMEVVNRHIKRIENNTRLNNKNVVEVANGLQEERISKH
jgi:hypothetical protein